MLILLQQLLMLRQMWLLLLSLLRLMWLILLLLLLQTQLLLLLAKGLLHCKGVSLPSFLTESWCVQGALLWRGWWLGRRKLFDMGLLVFRLVVAVGGGWLL